MVLIAAAFSAGLADPGSIVNPIFPVRVSIEIIYLIRSELPVSEFLLQIISIYLYYIRYSQNVSLARDLFGLEAHPGPSSGSGCSPSRTVFGARIISRKGLQRLKSALGPVKKLAIYSAKIV